MHNTSIARTKAWIAGFLAKVWIATRIPKITNHGANWLEARGFRALGFICRNSPLLVVVSFLGWAIVVRIVNAQSKLEMAAAALSGIYFALVLVLGAIDRRAG